MLCLSFSLSLSSSYTSRGQQLCKFSVHLNEMYLQIVRHDRTMEQIVFPVPNICEFLTHESKYRVFNTTERDEQGSKVNDFFQQAEDLYNEMKWQKKIRSKYGFHKASSMSAWYLLKNQ